jgi:tRNA threonylcarbamoyl adenosine modification protein YeaZ
MQQEISGSSTRPVTAPVLAIEVISRSGSIALFHDQGVMAATKLADDQRAAASLAPEIAKMAAEHLPGGTLDSLAFICVAAGPGSFTGLRIAVTTAKTLAFALEIPLVAVNSLAAIASLSIDFSPSKPSQNDQSAIPSPLRQSVLVGLAAYRGQVYRGRFPADGEADVDIVSAAQWQAELQRACDEKSFVFSGDRAVFDRSGVVIDAAKWHSETIPRAVGVGLVGSSMFARGETTPPMELVPDYLRPSAAEE